MSEKTKDDICKKETGQLASVKPTLGIPECLDAEAHKQDLIEQREKRNMNYSEPTVATPDEVYTPSRDDTYADRMKEEQDLSEEYAITEMEAMREPQKIGKPSPTPAIENEDEIPSEDD